MSGLVVTLTPDPSPASGRGEKAPLSSSPPQGGRGQGGDLHQRRAAAFPLSRSRERAGVSGLRQEPNDARSKQVSHPNPPPQGGRGPLSPFIDAEAKRAFLPRSRERAGVRGLLPPPLRGRAGVGAFLPGAAIERERRHD